MNRLIIRLNINKAIKRIFIRLSKNLYRKNIIFLFINIKSKSNNKVKKNIYKSELRTVYK